ncbi:MAG: hypothetical protein IJ303_00050 [Clostridia bacterium]|nr:hypothetical protein [Clostridia bacterium]
MKTAICDSRIPTKALDNLKKVADRVVLLPPFEALDAPVSAHPDMLLFPYPAKKIIFTHKDYFSRASELLGFLGYEIIPIKEQIGAKYPFDILLNAANVGNRIFGKLSHISSSLLQLALSENMELINVNQGYARCSLCTVSNNAAITADPSIADAAKNAGINVLSICHGGVALGGYSEGFIGGASGYDGESVYFCGDIMSHTNGSEISGFCERHFTKVISLSNEPLYDIGTIFFIYS